MDLLSARWVHLKKRMVVENEPACASYERPRVKLRLAVFSVKFSTLSLVASAKCIIFSNADRLKTKHMSEQRPPHFSEIVVSVDVARRKFLLDNSVFIQKRSVDWCFWVHWCTFGYLGSSL